MEENNTSIFTQAKIEYTQQLIDILTPSMFDGILSIYDESKVVFSTQTNLSILNIFRTFLEKIPEWNNELVEKETERIIYDSKCDWLDDLVTAVFISHTKILTSIGPNLNNTRINLTIPKTINFVHKCYINLAREIWKNPYLFYENVSGSDYQKNMRTIELIIKECIENTIRKLLPVKEILREHLDNFDNVNENTKKNNDVSIQEALLEEIRNLKKNYTPDNSDNEDNEDNEDKEESPTNISKSIDASIINQLISDNNNGNNIVVEEVNNNNYDGYVSPDEEKIKEECENIVINTVPDITENISDSPVEEMKYDNVDIIDPNKTNSDLMDDFKVNLEKMNNVDTDIKNNDILSPRINTIEPENKNIPTLNNDPLFNIPSRNVEQPVLSDILDKPVVEKSDEPVVNDISKESKKIEESDDLKGVLMGKQSKKEKNIKEITIVKKDTTDNSLGSINENLEEKTTEMEKYDPIKKEEELKEIVSVDVNNDDTETVDNFISDLNNMMEEKGLSVEKDNKKYTLFDDASENE